MPKPIVVHDGSITFSFPDGVQSWIYIRNCSASEFVATEMSSLTSISNTRQAVTNVKFDKRWPRVGDYYNAIRFGECYVEDVPVDTLPVVESALSIDDFKTADEKGK